MLENPSEIRRIDWSEALPFVRLFAALRLALSPTRMALGLMAVVCCYLSGRILDGVWGERGRVVVVTSGGRTYSEVYAYSTRGHHAFVDWLKEPRLDGLLIQELAGVMPDRLAEAVSEPQKSGGPFMQLYCHERDCLAGIVQGVWSGRWGVGGGPYGPEPSLGGSAYCAARGVCWLANQRPFYAILFGIINLVIFAFFGGAICRSAAVQSARGEGISIPDAMRFVRQRFTGFLAAPILPLGVFFALWVIVAIGGLFGMIPFLGELFTGLLYPLALLFGFAATVVMIVTLAGFHLMWPTIAVEGSDGFDALSRSASYLGSRIWHVLFYAFLLVVYGALSYVLVRLVLVVMLKLTHKFTSWGMSWITSGGSDSVRKLDAIWQMPAWADLSFLPVANGTALWGSFENAPLTGSEWLSARLFMIWIFLAVSVLGAFVVSFFFCGSTQMYFLLRRDVDATDFEEVYYEESDGDFFTPIPAGEGAAAEGHPDAGAKADEGAGT